MASIHQQIIENSNYTKTNSVKANEPKTSSTSVSGDQFLLLLTEQLKYQDPTNPMDNNDMLAQEAQFQSLSQMEALTESFSKFANVFQANSLMGQTVEVTVDGKTTSGVVEYVDLTDESGASISINNKNYPMSSVTKIYPQGTTADKNSTSNETNAIKDKVSSISDNVGDIAKKLSVYLGLNSDAREEIKETISETI